jgi:hypothetical protein
MARKPDIQATGLVTVGGRARDVQPVAEAVWRDPICGQRLRVSEPLRDRLLEMADDVEHGRLRKKIYYERLSVLAALFAVARSRPPASFDLGSLPTVDELRLGSLLGQTFHQGCSLRDVEIATQAPRDLIVAIGKRTIKRTKWLERL